MGRKQKKKQKAPNDGGESPDSTGRTVCNHARDSVNVGKVRKKVMNYKNQCEICDKGNLSISQETNLKFVCLQCGTFTCSHDHSKVHFGIVRSDPHDLAYSVVQEKAWCHRCEIEVSPKIAKAVNSCISTINSILTKNVVKSEDSSTSKLYGAEMKQETSSSSSKITTSCEGFPPVRGLVNLGNTCFFNSVLQCLARTPHLLEELRKMEKPGRHVRIELKDGRVLAGELGKWDHLTETLAEVLSSLTERGTSNGAVNPCRLLAALRKKHSQFEGYDQHDAHELLRLLLDTVRTAEQKRYRALLFPELGVTSKVNPAEVPKDKLKKARDLDHQMSQVVTFTPEHIFKGLLVSKLECQECSHSTECVEGFLDLSLPIVVDKHQPPLRKWSASSCVDKKNSQDNASSLAHMSSTAKKKFRRRMPVKSCRPNRKEDTGEEAEGKDMPDLTRMSLSPSREEELFICPEDGDVEDNDEPTKSDDRRRESGYSSEKGESYSSRRGSPALEEVSLVQGAPYDEDSARVSPNPLSAQEPFWHGNLDDFKLQLLPQAKPLAENDLTPKGGWSQARNPIPLLEDDTPDLARMFPQRDSTEKVHVLCRDSKTIMQEGGIKEENGVNERSVTEPPDVQYFLKYDEVPTCSTEQASKEYSNASPTCATPELTPSAKECVVDVEPCDSPHYDFSWDAPFAGCDNVSEDEHSLNTKDIVTPTCSPTISPILNGDLVGSPDANPNDLDILRQGTPSPVPNFTSCTPQRHPTPLRNHEGLDRNEINWRLKDLYEPTSLTTPLASAGCSFTFEENGTVEAKTAYPDTISVPLKNGYNYRPQGPKSQEMTSATTKEDEYSIQGCLGQFTCVEMMAGNNKVGCSTCTERQNKGKEGKTILTVWSKQLLISSAPSVLILHLKRFQVLACSSRKLSKHVAFPFTFDLSKFCSDTPSGKESNSVEDEAVAGGDSPSSTSLVYDLYGLVEHSGHLNGGHYVAYVKVVHKENTQWFCISDSHVSEVTQNTVSKCQAYLLFYSRVGC